MRRHRFIVDRWVWELPGSYADDGDDPAAAAAREVEEETGWRPRGIKFVISCKPLIGNADHAQDLYLAHGASTWASQRLTRRPGFAWVSAEETPGIIARGEILGAITIIRVKHVLLLLLLLLRGGLSPESALTYLAPPGACVWPPESRGVRPAQFPATQSDILPCTCHFKPRVYLVGDRGATAAA
jgi:hypothetical protein